MTPVFAADLALTDLYPDNLPQGNVYVRITNNGPGSLINNSVQLSCSAGKHPYGGGPPSAGGSSGPVTLTLNPGQTGESPTGISINTTIYWYDVTCNVQVHSLTPTPPTTTTPRPSRPRPRTLGYLP